MIKPQTLTAILKITMLAVALNSASLAQGETLNMPTTNIVIEKLDRLLETLDTDSTSKIPMTLRLADLHADRARLFELSEQNKNDHCDTCVTARKDRIEAIRLYNSVFTSLDKETKSKVLSQLAHLYELTTQSYKALELYKSVLKSEKDYSPELIGQASIGLGEMEFNLAKYKDAAKDFKRALEIKNLNRQGYVTTRLAWTYFHLGNLALAEKTMFSVLTNQNTADGSLKEESARDYATFLSQGKVGPSEIKNLSLASPEKVRKENLIYLATELDRLGKKNEAVLVWKSVGEASHTDSDDLSEHFRLAQLQYDLGHKDLTVGELVKTVSIWKDKGCKATEENCALLKAKFRKMLTDWAAAEERQPTATLVKAYAIYKN
jgi:tetratricopeptide (TPR) repeat protein